MACPHIVFDLDGTLVDSLPGIAEGVRQSLLAMQRPAPTPQQVRGMIGRGARDLCAQALGYDSVQHTPPDLLDTLYTHFCRIYPHCWQGELTRPYPSIPALLQQLCSAGSRLAVLSNKPHAVTLPMVQALFPTIPFSPIMGHTGQFPRKPAPDALLHIADSWQVAPADITLVGDSLYDARTAQAAGCRLVLVGWGYAQLPALLDTGAPLAHSVPELCRLLGLA